MKLQKAFIKAEELLKEFYIPSVYIEWHNLIFFAINKDGKVNCVLEKENKMYLTMLLRDSNAWKVWHLKIR